MKVVAFGELMLRLSPPGFQRIEQASNFDIQFGGSESNVAISLARFGNKVQFISSLPNNEIGEAAKSSLLKYSVGTDFILREGNRIGIYFLENGANSRQSKVVYDRYNSSFSEIESGKLPWEEIFKDVSWFHWSGITPAISQKAADVTKEAITEARKRGIKISADLNFRQNLWKYGKDPIDIMPELVSMSDVLLGGNDESKKVLGVDVPVCNDTTSVETEMDYIKERCTAWKSKFPNLTHIASTIRRSHSASHNFLSGVLWDGTKLYKGGDFEITNIVDRVGGGDAFMAGIIHGILNYKKDYQKIIDFSVAASCLKHSILGDVNLVSEDEVLKLIGNNKSIRISR